MSIPDSIMDIINDIDAQIRKAKECGYAKNGYIQLREFEYKELREYVLNGQEISAGSRQDFGKLGQGSSQANSKSP